METIIKRQDFLELCSEFKQHILKELNNKYQMESSVIEWIDQLIEYNCKDGKLNRGLILIECTRILLKSRTLTSQQYDIQEKNEIIKKACVLGWCVEWLQGSFLIADDIMDGSTNRRGKPCWYKRPDVGMTAINDAYLLEALVFKLLHHYFHQEKYYIKLIDLFHSVIYCTVLGQLMDLTSSQPEIGNIDLNLFTEERYYKIVQFKTAYYSFYLSVAVAMCLTGIEDEAVYKETEEICVLIGEFFQIQDDYLDCYGTPEMIGKIGTDIQDAKCSWLIVQALSLASPEDLKILQTNYGKSDKIEIIKSIYNKLKLQELYRQYEVESYGKILKHLDKVHSIVPKDIFIMLLDKIYKRKK